MSNSKPQAKIDLFNQAKEHFLPRPLLNLAKTGTIPERLKYILSVKTVTVYQMCRLCSVCESDVIYFLFKYKHNLTIHTYFANERYFFTTSTELKCKKEL